MLALERPIYRSNDFYTKHDDPTRITDFNATLAVTEDTEENLALLRDLEIISEELLDLQKRGIPILWRPFHEAMGAWFWWGNFGPETLKKLWKIQFDYFKQKELNNLIWIYTADAEERNLEWYPGDDMVDIIGIDIYPDLGDHNSQSVKFELLKELFGTKKIITLSECGSIPDPELAEEAGATWSWFMPWYMQYTIPGEEDPPYNSIEIWKKIMNHPFVLTLDQMPNYVPWVDEEEDSGHSNPEVSNDENSVLSSGQIVGITLGSVLGFEAIAGASVFGIYKLLSKKGKVAPEETNEGEQSEPLSSEFKKEGSKPGNPTNDSKFDSTINISQTE